VTHLSSLNTSLAEELFCADDSEPEASYNDDDHNTQRVNSSRRRRPSRIQLGIQNLGVPGAGEYDGEFRNEPETRPALRCNGRGALVGCGETMLRDQLAVVFEVDDDKSAAVLDASENVLGNDRGGVFSVIVIYSCI